MSIVESARREGTPHLRVFRGLHRVAVLCGLALAAAGCGFRSEPPLVPGLSSEQDVRARYGTPEIVWEEADGSREYQYRSIGDRTETRRVVFGPDGRLRGESNGLAPSLLDRIDPDWRIDDVRRWLGRPSETMFFALSDRRLWRWRIRDRDGAPGWFEAVFDARGTLLESSRVPASRDADSV